jgi:hypothetical protein
LYCCLLKMPKTPLRPHQYLIIENLVPSGCKIISQIF